MIKTVTLIIDKCDNCPYFLRGVVGDIYRERCKLTDRHPSYNTMNNHFIIPDWCPQDNGNVIDELKGEIETLKEQLNDVKHQFTPKNFEG